MRRRARQMVWLGVLLGLQPLRAARAQEPLAAPLRATILLRALAYERGVRSSRGDLVLAVVGTESASRDAAEMAAALADLARRFQVAGRRLRVTRITYRTGEQAAADLRRAGARAIYVARGTSADATAGLARGEDARGRPIVCGTGTQVGSGCVLGVESTDAGSRIVIQVTHARAAGLEFDARLLRIARLVR